MFILEMLDIGAKYALRTAAVNTVVFLCKCGMRISFSKYEVMVLIFKNGDSS